MAEEGSAAKSVKVGPEKRRGETQHQFENSFRCVTILTNLALDSCYEAQSMKNLPGGGQKPSTAK